MRSTAELIAESGRDPAGEYMRYVYDLAHLENEPGRASSAAVTPRVGSVKSPATGALLTGEKLHVALLRYSRGGTTQLHTHPNEQFTFVVEGTVRAEIAGEDFIVEKHCIAHIPPGVPHSIAADGGQDALVIMVQNNRYAFAA